MAATDDAEGNRLAGRQPKAPRADGGPGSQDAESDEATYDDEIEAVNRLMGFLRGDENDG